MNTDAPAPEAPTVTARPRRPVGAIVAAALIGLLTWWLLSDRSEHQLLVSSETASHAYIGNPFAGDATGNSLLFTYAASRRFMATHTGEVDRVRHNNRTLLERNITERCAANSTSQWCECLNNGLDAYTCGYHIPNSYSVGNGGLISVEIREDDGSDAHLPKDEVLGKIRVPYVPMDIQDQAFPTFLLEDPVKLEKGRLYHLVYRQLNPPKCALGHLAPDVANSCERDAGAVGLNGLFFFSRDAYKDGGPFLADSGANFYRHSVNEPWLRDPDNLSWYLLGYTDGQWRGHAMDFYRSYDKYAMQVGGQNRIRQRFPLGNDVLIDGLWIRVSRLPGAKSGPLTVQLKDDDGVVLSSMNLASGKVRECERCGGDWIELTLPSRVMIESNGKYAVEFSAPQGAKFNFPSGFELSYKPYLAESGSFWSNARVESSTDGGVSWGIEPGNAYAEERDLSLLLSVPQIKAAP